MPTPPAGSLNTTTPTGAPGTKTPRLAGPGIRLGAFALDAAGAIAATIVATCTLIVAGIAAPPTIGAVVATLGAASPFLVPLIAIALYAALTSHRGSSIGHRILGLQVVDIESRRLVSLPLGMLRTIVLFGPVLLAPLLRLVYVVASLNLGTTPQLHSAYETAMVIMTVAAPLWWVALLVQVSTGRRALHDRAAGTMVLAWKVRPTQS